MGRTWKKEILWHVLQLHLRMRVVLVGPSGGEAETTGGGRVRKVM